MSIEKRIVKINQERQKDFQFINQFRFAGICSSLSQNLLTLANPHFRDHLKVVSFTSPQKSQFWPKLW